MSDWNLLAVIILLALFFLWKLDLIATLLNLKAFPDQVPTVLTETMSAEDLERCRDYSRTNASYHITKSSIGLVVFIAFWGLGGFAILDNWSRALAPGNPVLAGLAFLAACTVGMTLFNLPFGWYETFVLEEKFGFNRSTASTFWTDRFKGLLMTAVLGLPIAALVVWIFLRIPNAWLWAWLTFTAFQLLMTWLAPSLIMPLFNKFTPMPNTPLKQRIRELGERCGFPLEGVFVMDGSKRSTKANAFFTGFGKRKKIALFDTLMEKHEDDELLAVLAHEIGHFRRGHIRQRLLVGLLQSAVLFFLLGLATNPEGAFARQLFDAFGVGEISPHVGIILFFILFEPVNLLLGVLSNAWSRRHEFEADAFAADAIGASHPLAVALKKLSTDQLSHPAPHPLRVWLDYSHPPLLERLNALAKL